MSFRSLIFDHLWLKVFSLVLATLIWLAVHANLQNEPVLGRKFGKDSTFSFVHRPILVLFESSDHPIVSVVPQHASITIEGPANLVDNLKDDDVDVFVRVSDRQPLGTNFPVHVRLPAGATLKRVDPLSAKVSASNPPDKPTQAPH